MAAPTLTPLAHINLKAAIKTLAQAGITAAGTGTKLFPRQLEALEDGASPSSFLDGPTPGTGKVNALMFWPVSILPPPTAFSPLTGRTNSPFDPRNVAQVGDLKRDAITYAFKLYYAFRDGSDDSNSTDEVMALITAINTAFGKAPKLNLNSYRIDRHSGLAWPELKTLPFGEMTAHICNGLLTVLIHASAQG